MRSAHLAGNTVGAVIATAPAFRLADFTADRESHPALKICGRKGMFFSHIFIYLDGKFLSMGMPWAHYGGNHMKAGLPMPCPWNING